MKDFILKHFKILNKVFGRYRFFQVWLRNMQKDKFFKLGNMYIRLSNIYQMSELEMDLINPYKQYLIGFINGEKYKEHICVSQYRREYRFEEIKKNDFYQEYTNLFYAFKKYNNL